MKIAIFTDTFHPDINGVARTLKHFAAYLDDKKIAYKIFAPKSPTNEYISTNIHRFNSFSFFLYPECRLAFPNLLKIKSELEEFSPDIIHVATTFNMGIWGIYFARKLNIPLVGSYHTDFDYYLKFYDLQFLSNVVWKYMRWFHKPFKKIFVPSQETLKQLSRHGFSNLEIWSGGVNCKIYHPFYDVDTVRKRFGLTKKYLLSFVGRLAPEKDVKTLLAIAKALPPEIQEQIDWLVVGDGPSRDELQNEAPSNMIFTGYLLGEQLAEVYSASDLFVFPSPTETFGNVVLEALASGTPAIVANAGGVKNIVKAGVTGQLCQPGDTHDFVNCIIKLLQNDHLRNKLGHEARDYALSQSWERIFNELLDDYSFVLDEPNIQKYA